MKIQLLIIVFSLSLGIILNGCESPTNTKAESVTAPQLISPEDNKTNVSLTPTFKWNNPGHKIEIASNSSFSSPEFSYSDLNGTTEFVWNFPNNLLNNKDYYWRVGVVSGSTYVWSETFFHFKTVL